MGALSVTLQGSAAAGWFVAAAWLAGYSESSQGRWSARVVAAFAVLVLGTLAVQLAAGAAGHSLVMIVPFALGTALALLAGATKLERALQQTERDRALRRAKGLLAGAFLSLVALSLATLASALAASTSARWVWLHALPIVSGVACVFAGRARWLGLAALASVASARYRAVGGGCALGGAAQPSSSRYGGVARPCRSRAEFCAAAARARCSP
jgi:peptidoglycan/LPS O-acetylase OafA/YrhL